MARPGPGVTLRLARERGGAGAVLAYLHTAAALPPTHTALVTGHLPGRKWIPRSAYEPKGTYSEESRAGGSGGRP